jgi:hypothetical protein
MIKMRLPVLSALLLLSLSACSSAGLNPLPQSYPRLAFTTPPAPIFEEKPHLQNPQIEIWRPGYWAYDGVAFDWVPGRVIEKPAPYADWSPDRWEKRSFGWSFVPGTWI